MFPWGLQFSKRSLVFPILLFSSISLHWLLRQAFLSLLTILWNSAFRWEYLSFSLLFFSQLFLMASSDSLFAFLHFFSMGTVLIPVSCTMSRTSVHSSSGTLSDLGPKSISYFHCVIKWQQAGPFRGEGWQHVFQVCSPWQSELLNFYSLISWVKKCFLNT